MTSLSKKIKKEEPFFISASDLKTLAHCERGKLMFIIGFSFPSSFPCGNADMSHEKAN